MNERGQVTPLLGLVVVAIGGLLFGLARFGATVSHSAQAQAAADAAALAGAAEDSGVGEALAAANGGEVATYEELGGREVEVRVRVGETWAVARARRVGGGAGGGVTGWVGQATSGGVAARLAPVVRDALEAAAALLHQPVPLVGGSGRAVDVPRSFAARLEAVASRVGLCRQSRTTDPVRFVSCPSSTG
jgi:hypothetical protein